MGNKLTTLGYFKKRLRDCGYVVDDLYKNYSQLDPRAWTVVIDPGCASLFCTCYHNANKDNAKLSQPGEEYFELYDGGQFIPGRMCLKTASIEVLIEYLVQFGINNKAPNYLRTQQPTPQTTPAQTKV